MYPLIDRLLCSNEISIVVAYSTLVAIETIARLVGLASGGPPIVHHDLGTWMRGSSAHVAESCSATSAEEESSNLVFWLPKHGEF
jgi:hypothetical protein